MAMQKRHPVRNMILLLLIVILSAAVGVGGFFGVKGYQMYREAVSRVSVEEKIREIQETEHFVKYTELPKFYVEAVVSVEDRRFWKHPGIDPIAICRALVVDIKAMSFEEGGSTITQQLAKNMFFTQEKKMERKAAEVFAVLDIESKYSKEEILELYVNTACFGSDYFGIYDAAKGYFGKEPSELTDYEAAMLAGVPNSPSRYSPDISMEMASRRVGQVLDSMVRNKLITSREADAIRSSGGR